MAEFTPTNWSPHLCHARTWNNGFGGQCVKKQKPGYDFCQQHIVRGLVHGRLDGPIPQAKLEEFKKANRHRLSSKPSLRELSDASLESLNEYARRCGIHSDAALKKLMQRPAYLHSDETKMEVVERISQLQGAADGERKRIPCKRPAKAELGAQPVKMRCTCGCPIHKETCELFRKSASDSSSSQAPQVVPNEPAGKTLEKQEAATSPLVLHDWFKTRLAEISAELCGKMLADRIAIYRRLMLQYHPDKRLAQQRCFEGPSDADMTRLFVEVKRRYDQERSRMGNKKNYDASGKVHRAAAAVARAKAAMSSVWNGVARITPLSS
mmetsp:Transcript_75914/g.210736  ORF Transcript_75914/g.210736 Transcript_75914/m.210736 type:complete len:324 (+) Transcript_75914:75-1046(+)